MTCRPTSDRAASHHRNADRHCIVLDTEAPRWTYHRVMFAGDLPHGKMPHVGWATACGRHMWSGRHGRGPGCIGNRNVIERVAEPCLVCYPELKERTWDAAGAAAWAAAGAAAGAGDLRSAFDQAERVASVMQTATGTRAVGADPLFAFPACPTCGLLDEVEASVSPEKWDGYCYRCKAAFKVERRDA